MPGISLAPGDNWNVASPTWQRIDTTYNVQSFTVDRGRQNEMGRADTGTATVELVDRVGAFDPTNSGGAFYNLGPGDQARIELQNPVTSTWKTLFRGFVASIQWVPYRREDHANVTLELADGLAVLAACEMAATVLSPGVPRFGDEILEGNIIFHEDLLLNAVQTRINKVLDQAGWPAGLRSVFTGNVALQASTYPARTTILTVLEDAAEAEFPDTALFFIGGPKNPGSFVFHGRLARFHPATVEYDITTWQLGDDTAAAVSPTTVVRISPPLTASLDDTLLYTSAYCTPNDPTGLMTETDFSGQYVTDAAAAAKKGLRTWSAEGLYTRKGAATTTALAETKLFADYVRDNYKTPRVRVGQLTIKARTPSGVNGTATWKLLTEVEISDIVHLKTTHTGGGGFNTDFYVEGIHYAARPGPGYPYVELTLDVSPKGYYDANPFG